MSVILSSKNTIAMKRFIDLANEISSAIVIRITSHNTVVVKAVDCYKVSELSISLAVSSITNKETVLVETYVPNPEARVHKKRLLNTRMAMEMVDATVAKPTDLTFDEIIISIVPLLDVFRTLFDQPTNRKTCLGLQLRQNTLVIFNASKMSEATTTISAMTNAPIQTPFMPLTEDSPNYRPVSFLSTDLCVMLLNASLPSTWVQVSLQKCLLTLFTKFELGEVKITKTLCGRLDTIDCSGTYSFKFLKTLAITAGFQKTTCLYFPDDTIKYPLVFSTKLENSKINLAFFNFPHKSPHTHPILVPLI
jgi:hypothetical protein